MNCKIIQDLLPLYRDGVCSAESRQAVEEHIQNCRACAQALGQIEADETMTIPEQALEIEKAQVIQGVKRRFSRRKRLSVLVTAAVMLGMFAVFTAAADVKQPVPYREGMIEASLASDDVIDIYYDGGNYADFRALTREFGGRTVLFLCYTRNLKSDVLPMVNSAGKPESRGHLSMGNGLLLDTVKGTAIQVPTQDQLGAVYYLAGDYAQLTDLTDGEFSAAARENAVLLWQRG